MLLTGDGGASRCERAIEMVVADGVSTGADINGIRTELIGTVSGTQHIKYEAQNLQMTQSCYLWLSAYTGHELQ